jgi:hypothetical protein
MRCSEARKKLADYGWHPDAFSQEKELMAHLDECLSCRSLILAEQAIAGAIAEIGKAKPTTELAFDKVKAAAETESYSGTKPFSALLRKFDSALNFLSDKKYRLAICFTIAVFGFLAFVPFNFREWAGYEIAIAGIDKDIVEDNAEITSLFCALGMEKEKTLTLSDSLDIKKIRLNVGECRETCYLTISDLKSEKDVAFVVKQIIDLGCCQIDKIAPIFRNESSSLLKHIARKLLS